MAIEALCHRGAATRGFGTRRGRAAPTDENNIGLTLQEARSDIAAETELAARDELELPDDVL